MPVWRLRASSIFALVLFVIYNGHFTHSTQARNCAKSRDYWLGHLLTDKLGSAARTPAADPAVSPTPTSPATVPDSARDLLPVVLALRDALADELDLPPHDVRVMNLREQQWSSTSPGCPEPARFYAQIVTQRFEVEIMVGGGSRILHVSDGRVVDCTNRTP